MLFTWGIGSTSKAVRESAGSVHVVRCNPPDVGLSRRCQFFGTSIVKIDPVSRTGTIVDVVLACVAVVVPVVAARS